MDFVKKFATEGTDKSTTTTPPEKKDSSGHPEGSQGELYASAQVVSEAARATFQGESKKVDNAKLAGACGDLLDAAQKYGKLDDSTGMGSYVEKAENYLHEYETSHSTTTPAKTPEGGEPAKAVPPATKETKEAKPETGEPAKADPPATKETEEAKPETGGYGDMMKMAGGFLKKN